MGCHVSELCLGETNVTFDVTSPTQRLVTRQNGSRQQMRIQSNMRHLHRMVPMPGARLSRVVR
jgi:hypothetical protein